MTIEIKSRFTGGILFSVETESLKLAVEAAVKGGSDLQGAYLRGSDLQGAHLQGADLWGAYLQGSDLRGADLQGSDLQGAHLRGADLRGAYLRGSEIQARIKIQRAPIQVFGLQYPITIWDSHIQIGCKFHSMGAWENFTDEEIDAMDVEKSLVFWKAHKTSIFALAASDGRWEGK